MGWHIFSADVSQAFLRGLMFDEAAKTSDFLSIKSAAEILISATGVEGKGEDRGKCGRERGKPKGLRLQNVGIRLVGT